MKILIISDTFPYSNKNKNKIDLNLALAYSKAGHQVSVFTVCTERDQEVWNQKMEGTEITIYRFYISPHSLWVRIFGDVFNPLPFYSLRKVLIYVEPHTVHIHKINRYISYFSLLIISRYVKNILMTAHDAGCFAVNVDTSYWNTYKRFFPFRRPVLIRFLINSYVQKLYTVSYNLQAILNKSGVRTAGVIYNGVDVDFWSNKDTHRTNDPIQIDSVRGPCLLYVGQLSAAKNYSTILRAYKALKIEFTDLRLISIGESRNDYEQLESEAADMSVVEINYIDATELRKYYQTCNIVITYAIVNPISMVALEARAAGCSVVWGCAAGADEIPWRVHDIGYIDNVTDPNKLIEVASQLLRNQDLRVKNATWGKNLVINNFSLKICADKYLSAFMRSK